VALVVLYSAGDVLGQDGGTAAKLVVGRKKILRMNTVNAFSFFDGYYRRVHRRIGKGWALRGS